MGLLLDAADVDVDGSWRWRWALRDAGTGDALAEHQVVLDPDSDEVTAFGSLRDYALWHESPDYWRADEVRILRQAGTWAGRVLLGEAITRVITAAAPVTVRVSVPEALERVLLWPLELAYAGDSPLASRGDVAFVYDIEAGAGAGDAKDEVTGALRMLAVFCLPVGTALAAIRRERYELSRLVRRLAERDGLAVELRVLQYGVSRERLAEVIAGDDGWDIVYLASHGGRGRFGLERPDGTADWIDTAALMSLLRPTRHRVKLAMVWACQSAAEEAAAPLRLIDPAGSPVTQPGPPGASQVMGVAQGMVRELGCAVVATRYEVPAECPAQFNEVFFESLLASGQPVDEAAARALAALWQDPDPGERAVNAACPGVFGAPAVGLRLPAPRGASRPDPARRVTPLPAEAERFVGRASVMAQASAALAAGSGKSAVMLHGMPGAGTTTCAVELAYRYADSFTGVAFWRAPGQRLDPGGALADFAAALRAQLGDDVPAAPDEPGAWRWRRYTARLRRALRSRRLLIVIDGLDQLPWPSRSWRDPRWKAVFRALVSRGGAARVVLTVPAAPAVPGGRLVALPVFPLSPAESHALLRELPALRALLWGNTRLPSEQDRALVREMLAAAGGLPALLDLMDSAAADRAALGERLAAARNAADEAAVQAASEGSAAAVRRLFAFLGSGATAGPAGRLRGAVAEWVTASVASAGRSGQLMAAFLSCLTEEDRCSSVIAGTWPGLWQRLGRAGEPPRAGPLLEHLTSTKMPASDSAARDGQGREGPAYQVHPLVAEMVRQAMAPRDRELADAELAAYWSARESMAALPYLVRRQDWDGAAALVRAAMRPEAELGAGRGSVPALRRVAGVTGTPAAKAALGRAVWTTDRAESRRLLEESIAGATAARDYRLAWIAAGDLADVLVRTGRLAEALAVAGQRGEHARIAGLGPCTQLSGQAQRLRIEGLMGRHEQVLAEAEGLLARLARLPQEPPAAGDGAAGWWARLARLPGEPPAADDATDEAGDDGDELVDPWVAREGILAAAGASARATGKWQQALGFGAEITASQRLRGASATVIARQEAADAGTLIQLGRLSEAAATLVRCQQAATGRGDRLLLCDVLSARADLEEARDDPAGAVELERDSIGVRYGAGADPGPIAASHRRLAAFLREAGQSPAEQRAHLLAAALIDQLSDTAPDTSDIRELASLKWTGFADAVKVLTVADVVRYTSRTDGVRLPALLATLAPDPVAIDTALVKISWLIAAGRLDPVVKAVGGLVRKLTDEPPTR